MKPTGYGSWLQEIVIEVADADKAAFAHQLGIQPLAQTDDTGTARFIWTRKSWSFGNDEDAVWDLTVALGDLAGTNEWIVDWGSSHVAISDDFVSPPDESV
jgi:hypothetical protein